MKVIGIIAEYNPFHNGHAYQIEKIRKELQADYIVVAMSGDFVQRGAPAILDKYARTKMALSCGADLVVELPVLWATSSAESFAMAGVTLFEKMGCVDGICFGAETDDTPLLEMLASILAEEPHSYKTALALALKEGKSFPVARAEAITTYLSQQTDSITPSDFKRINIILNTPNNILALEYLKAIKRRGSSLEAYPIKREGADYHESEILSSSVFQSKAPAASATGIRNLLASTVFTHTQEKEGSVLSESLASAMPQAALSILLDYISKEPLLDANNFSAQLGYQLLVQRSKGFANIMDCNEDISNRLKKNLIKFSSFSDFCENNKSRDITYTRMSRILTHLLLGIDQELETLGKSLDYIPYLRILGFRKSYSLASPSEKKTSGILALLKETAKIPLISKLSSADSILSSDALTLLEKDLFASDLYEQTKSSLSTEKRTFQTEYSRQIVIVP